MVHLVPSSPASASLLEPRLAALVEARTHEPFAALGWHQEGAGWVLRVLDPRAERVALVSERGAEELTRVNGSALFELRRDAPARPARLRADGRERI
jgi:1,4-alpha-glucan branching enzyme